MLSLRVGRGGYVTLYRWTLGTTLRLHRQKGRQKNICSASWVTIRGIFETQDGLKWEIIAAFVAVEDFFGKER